LPPAPWRLKRRVLSGEASKKATERVVFGAENPGYVLPNDDALVSWLASAVDGIGDLAKSK